MVDSGSLTEGANGHQSSTMSDLPTMTPAELRAFREELGITQADAAKLLGVATHTYKRWEMGIRSIPGPAVILTGIRLEQHRRKSD